MNTLKNLLLGALLTLPVMTLNAATIQADKGAELRPTLPVAGCCYILIMGRWTCVPC